MANQLEMAVVHSIYLLHAQGLSGREIARKLGIGRGTVSRHLKTSSAAGSNGAIAPMDPDRVPEAPNGANAPTGCEPVATSAESAPTPVERAVAGPVSRAAAWREFILTKHAQGLSAKRIHQDLMEQPGVAQVSYDSVRRLLKRETTSRPVPVRRMECTPGAEAQVDFGKGAPIVTAEGKRRRSHVFRVVLSHSRKGYSESRFRQTTDDFIACLENAFWHFGGVPQTLVIDNLRAAVTHPDWFDPELVPKLLSFCQHYGTVILPTKPYTPRHKGKVERGIGYVKNNGLAGRQFTSLGDQNQHLAHWEQTIADTRIHGTTKQQVHKVFLEVERAALRPLPSDRFPFFHEAKRSVNRDGHIEVEKAYYSAPPEYLGREVWARWDQRLIRIFNHRLQQIRIHVRMPAGKFSTDPQDVHPQKISGVERGATWLLHKVQQIGPQSHAWAQAMVTARGIEGTRVLQGLLALKKRHPAKTLEKACEIALSYGAYRLRTIRKLLSRNPPPQQPLPFLDEHPIIRPLDDYARIVTSALQRQADRSSMSEGFLRNHWAKEFSGSRTSPAQEKRPGDRTNDSQGATEIPPPRSEEPSSGCTSAEPDSISPDHSSLPFVSSPFHQEPFHE